MINLHLISANNKISNKEKLFEKIAQLLHDNKKTKNVNGIIKDLQKRESLGSTAFDNGLMIPHARTKFIESPTLVIVEFSDVDFDSIDGKKTNFAIAILVPDEASNEHLKILSKLSTLFSNQTSLNKFKKLPNTKKVKQINNLIAKKSKQPEGKTLLANQYDFVAITSCAAGIAHTYMARDALIEGAKKLNLVCKIETRGAITENKLKAPEIDMAKFVIIAADIHISKTPFLGKKIYSIGTNAAIKNPVDVINKAQQQKITYGKGERVGKLQLGGTDNKRQKLLGKSIMYALSFMIPITIVGGILMAIPNALAAGGNTQGGTWHFPNSFVAALWDFGNLGLILMVPILAMFLAYKIGGKPAMPAALLGGYFINDGALMGKFSIITLPQGLGTSVSAGFLGGLVVGIIVGYGVRWMRWIKWHRYVKPIAPLMIIPLLSSFITFLIVVYVIGSPMTWVMSILFKGLAEINAGGIWVNIGIGVLFAGMMAIDLGGPINKTTLVVATVIFATTLQQGKTNFIPQTAVQAAISIPPLGMWLSTIIYRKKFSLTEIAAGQAALPMGLVGITEGSLPFAFRNPLKAIIANVSGAMVAGGLVTLFEIHFYGGLGSPLGTYLGYVENSFYGLTWIFSIMVGTIVTALIFGSLRNRKPEYEKIYKKIKEEKKEAHLKLGLNTKLKVFKWHVHSFNKAIVPKTKKMINPKNWVERPAEWEEQ